MEWKSRNFERPKAIAYRLLGGLGRTTDPHGKNKRTKNLEGFLDFLQTILGLICGRVTKADGKLDLIIQFPQRAKGNLQETKIFGLTLSTASFDDVGRN